MEPLRLDAIPWAGHESQPTLLAGAVHAHFNLAAHVAKHSAFRPTITAGTATADRDDHGDHGDRDGEAERPPTHHVRSLSLRQ
jgi:hypothetical protein